MSHKKYIITLATEEKSGLEIIARSYRHSQRERNRAKALLLADTNREGGSHNDTLIAETLGCQPLTVHMIRQRACLRGVLDSLSRKVQEKRKPRRLDGEGEARLITLACSQAPDGRKRWTLQLLKEKLVQMEIVESIHAATICRTLKKTRSSLG